MTFSTILEPDLWAHVNAILRLVPPEFDVFAYRTDAELIDALGRAGALDALRSYRRALARYYSVLVFSVLRAATAPPIAGRKVVSPKTLFDDRSWSEMFEVPWRRPSE